MNIKTAAAFSVTAILLLSACSGEPEWKATYETCQDKVKQGMAELNESQNTQAFSNFAQSAGMAACEMIKASCEKAPESPTCKAIIDGYKEQ